MGLFLRELGRLLVSSAHRANWRDLEDWRSRLYAPPSPPQVKRAVLRRNGIPNSTWVETGTFQGDTTAFLAEFARRVHSIEPEPALFQTAAERFRNTYNVCIHRGLSEEVLPKLLPQLSGDVSFWLDGHFSAGITHKGPIDTPILQELSAIEKNMNRYTKLAVMIDDMRCFDPTLPEYSSYPSIDEIVDWARRNELTWHIEQDILIARRAT